MRRLISALTIALLVLGPVSSLLSADAIASGSTTAELSHAGHDMMMADHDRDMDTNCPMTDPGACCGIAGGHCATGVTSVEANSRLVEFATEAILPERTTVRYGAHADIDIPPPRV